MRALKPCLLAVLVILCTVVVSHLASVLLPYRSSKEQREVDLGFVVADSTAVLQYDVDPEVEEVQVQPKTSQDTPKERPVVARPPRIDAADSGVTQSVSQNRAGHQQKEVPQDPDMASAPETRAPDVASAPETGALDLASAPEVGTPDRASASDIEATEAPKVDNDQNDGVPQIEGKRSVPRADADALTDQPTMLHSSGCDVTTGNALYEKLQHEQGLQRLISVIERLLFHRSARVGKCAQHKGSAAARSPPLCISPCVLGNKPLLRPLTDAFNPTEVEELIAMYQKHTEEIQVTHSKPSFPLITGDGFKFAADFQCDTKPNQKDDCSLDPKAITNRSVIFVNTLDVPTMVHKLPKIDAHFFMITHNRDKSVPVAVEAQALLDSPKVLKWFAKNIDMAHPKMVPIPIGIENRFYKNGEHPEDYLDLMLSNTNRSASRDILINFTPRKYNLDRNKALEAMKQNGFGGRQTKKIGHKNFLEQSRRFRFVLSPPGNGISCHRTWEALYMNRVPIVPANNETGIYADLPVLVVDDWFSVTKEVVDAQWEPLMRGPHDPDKLWQPWWLLHMLRIALRTP